MKLVLKKDNLCYIVNNWGYAFAPDKFYLRKDSIVEFYTIERASKKLAFYSYQNEENDEHHSYLRRSFDDDWL